MWKFINLISANPDDDIDNVSVGGMDVSDIDDDGPPMTSRRSDTSGSIHHPRPPPRLSRNQKPYAQPLVCTFFYSYI